MANQFDHIEDSIKKAFEGFELPVSDKDWSAISSALDKEPKRRGILWFGLFKNKRSTIFLALILALLGAGTFVWIKQTPVSKTITKAPLKEHITAKESGKASGGAGTADKVAENTAMEHSGVHKTKTDGNSYSPPQSVNSKNAIADGESYSPVVKTAKPVSTEKTINPGVQEPVPVTSSKLKSFGLRTFFAQVILKAFPNFPLWNPERQVSPPKGMESGYYFSLNTTFAPGKVSGNSGTGIWEGFQWQQGKNPALNFRLEGGIEMGTPKLKFTLGGALEGNPLTIPANDTIRIKVAYDFFPYMDQHGKVLYMLGRKYKDSTIIIKRNPQKYWAEIPIGIKSTISLKGNTRLSIGATANPGILLGARGEMANPYLTQSGSYWSYVHGINADTTSATIDAHDFMNKVRMGAGLHLGLEKEMGPFVWGLNLQSRYYFTPVWKKEVPINENTLQYGLNLRLGIKI